MKKLVLIAFVAVLTLGACSKNIVPQKNDHAISFATYSPKAVEQVSKAAAGSVLSGTNFAANAAINVYAWNSGNTAFAQSATAPNFMNNDGTTGSVVTLSANPGSTPSSNYTPIKFWPTDEDNNLLSFIGFYPAGATPGYTLNWTGAANVVNANITVPAATASQIDFMASDVVNDQKYSATTPAGNVQLNFHHLMTQVKVLVKTDAETDAILSAGAGAPVLTVSAIRFLDIKNKGVLTTTYSAGTTTHAMAANGETTETYVFSPATPLDLVGTSTTAKFLPSGNTTATENDAFMLVPQALVANAQQAEITYKITYADATFNETTVAVDLYDGSVKTWGQNKRINYTFVISLHPITFTTSLSDWEDVNPDPFNF